LHDRNIVLADSTQDPGSPKPTPKLRQTVEFYGRHGLDIYGRVDISNFPEIARLEEPPIVLLEVSSPDTLTQAATGLGSSLMAISQKSLLVAGPNAAKALLVNASSQKGLGLVPLAMINGYHCSAYIECSSIAISVYSNLGQNEPVEDIVHLRNRCVDGQSLTSQRSRGIGFGNR